MSVKFVCVIFIAFLHFVCKLFQHLLACSTNTSDLVSMEQKIPTFQLLILSQNRKKKRKEENLFPQTNESENHVKTNWVFHMEIGTRCPYTPSVRLILKPLHTFRNTCKQAALPGEGAGGRRHILLSAPCPWERMRTTTTAPCVGTCE